MSGARRQRPPAAPTLRLVLCPEPSAATAGGGSGPLPAAMQACIRDICALLAGQTLASQSAAPRVPDPAELAVLAASPAQAACLRRALADAGVSTAAEHLQPDPSCAGDGGSAATAPAAAAVACLMAAMLHGGGGQTAARLLACPLLALSAAQAHALTCDAEAMDRLCEDLHLAADLWQRCGLLPACRLFMQRSGAEARLMRSRGGRQVQEACLDLCRHLQGGHGSWGGPAGQYRALRRLCAGPPSGGADAAVPPGGGRQEARVRIVTPAAARSRRWQQVFMPCPAPAACRAQAAVDAASEAAVPRPGSGSQGQGRALGPLLQAARACAGDVCCIYAAIPPAADQGPGSGPAVSGPGTAAAVPGLPRGVQLPPALAEFAAAHPGALEISLHEGAQSRYGVRAADSSSSGAPRDAGGVSHTCRSLACWLQRCSHPAVPAASAASAEAAAAEADGGVQAGVISRFDFPDTPAGEAFLLRMFRGVHWPSSRSPDHLCAVVAAALEEHGAQPAALQGWGSGEAQARAGVLTAWLHDIVRASLLQLPITGGQCLADLAERDFVSDMRFCLSLPQLEPGVLCDLCRSCDLALARSAGVPLHAAWLQGLRPVPMAETAPRGWLRGTLELVVRLNGGRGPRYFVINAMSPCLGHRAADYAAPRMLEDLLCPRRRGDLLLMLQTLVLYRHLCLRHGPLSGPSRRALYEDQVGGVLHLYLRGLVAGQGDSGILHTRMDFDTLQELDRLCTAGERRT